MYDKENIFAQIIAKNIPATIIYEDERLLAFNDINPVAPVHILIIPKEEYIDYSDFILKSSAEEIKYFFTKIIEITKKVGVDKTGYRLITNQGTSAGQSIFHFHFHIIAGNNITDLVC